MRSVPPTRMISRSWSVRSSFDLQVALQVAHLVEEQGGARGLLEEADLAAHSAPVKAPFSWPKSSASRMLSGSAATLTA